MGNILQVECDCTRVNNEPADRCKGLGCLDYRDAIHTAQAKIPDWYKKLHMNTDGISPVFKRQKYKCPPDATTTTIPRDVEIPEGFLLGTYNGKAGAYVRTGSGSSYVDIDKITPELQPYLRGVKKKAKLIKQKLKDVVKSAAVVGNTNRELGRMIGVPTRRITDNQHLLISDCPMSILIGLEGNNTVNTYFS